MRRHGALALVLIGLQLGSVSCTHAQAPKARLVGEVLALAGVAGLMASGAINKWTDTDPHELAVASSVISITGLVTFAVGELTDEPTGPSAATKHRWAKIWIERAQVAARGGNCERVASIEPRVRRLDPKLYELVFMRDPDVGKCLMPGGSRDDSP